MTIPLPSATYPDTMVPGEGDVTFWRIATTSDNGALPPNPMTLEYVQSQLDHIPDDFRVEIAALLNGNRYRVRCAVAEQLYKPLGSGHVLLVGDAAHVHSPAGGQGPLVWSDTSHNFINPWASLRFPGLNLGICDAMRLAKTISSHTKSQDNQLLFDYSTNRRARAVQVIELSSSGLSMIGRIRNSAFIRRWIVGFIFNRIGFLKSRVVWRLSGLGTNAR